MDGTELGVWISIFDNVNKQPHDSVSVNFSWIFLESMAGTSSLLVVYLEVYMCFKHLCMEICMEMCVCPFVLSRFHFLFIHFICRSYCPCFSIKLLI